MVTATFRLISLLLSTLKKDRFLSSMLNATLELLSRSSPYSFLTIQELKWVCCNRTLSRETRYDLFMIFLQIEHHFLKTLTCRKFFYIKEINFRLYDKISYSSPTVVKEAVNKRMTTTTVISKTRESLSKTNALSSDRSKAGVKKSLFIAASPSRPMNPKNFRAKSCP